MHTIHSKPLRASLLDKHLARSYGIYLIRIEASANLGVLQLKRHAVHHIARNHHLAYEICRVAGRMTYRSDSFHVAGQSVVCGEDLNAVAVRLNHCTHLRRALLAHSNPTIVLDLGDVERSILEHSLAIARHSADVVAVHMSDHNVVDVGCRVAGFVQCRQQLRIVVAVARIE